jgi:transcriptional regulator with XRE-family HTH domain
MTLAEWLFKNRKNISHRDLARKLKVSAPYFSRIVNYKYVPSVKLAKEIQEATNGEVIWHEIIDQAIAAQNEVSTK